MNSKEIITKVNEKLNLDDKSLLILSEIVNENSIIGKKNKEKMINEFMNKLNIDYKTSEHYYEVFSEIIFSAIKDKLKHPFKNLDKKEN